MKSMFTYLRITSLFILFFLLMEGAMANYLRVRNLSYDLTAGTVTFDLTWDNSWRIDGMGSPNHWDAAWVFVKWRECGAAVTTDWTHGLVSTTLGDHSFGDLEPTLSDGSAVGIDGASNNTGVMLRQDSVGLFPTGTYSTITLKLNNLPATGDFEVKAFGIEMVFVPQAAYMYNGSLVSTEDSVTFNAALPAAYPKGYDAFYCMKYEISQGQYASFLNTLIAPAQALHYPGLFNSYRNRITAGGTAPDIYFSDRPDRACNYINWTDLLAYLDWAALRPMSELEFTKACRGEGAFIPREYAWGSTIAQEALLISTPEDGTELVQTANANVNGSITSSTITGGDGGRGPIRVGIYATATTDSRQETGASFYGIMELSGNVWEQCVRDDDTTYDGLWGDGYLDPGNYLADVLNWPFATENNTSSNAWRAYLGGSFISSITYLEVDNRSQASYRYNSRNSYTYDAGGRGVR